MQTITEAIIDAGLTNHLLTETDLARLLGGTAARRYALVNKALKHGELVRITRGLYILAKKYSREKISRLVLANHIVAYSYVSLESALAYHGWIPELVATVFSVIPSGRSRTFATEYGEYAYERISTYRYEFLVGVEREIIDGQVCLIASPLRALVDYVYLRKPETAGVDFLEQSLRIERDAIKSIQATDIEQLEFVFRSRRVLAFLEQLRGELKNYDN